MTCCCALWKSHPRPWLHLVSLFEKKCITGKARLEGIPFITNRDRDRLWQALDREDHKQDMINLLTDTDDDDENDNHHNERHDGDHNDQQHDKDRKNEEAQKRRGATEEDSQAEVREPSSGQEERRSGGASSGHNNERHARPTNHKAQRQININAPRPTNDDNDNLDNHHDNSNDHNAQQQVNIKAPQPTNDDNDYIDNHHSNNIHNHDNHDPLDEQATFLREIVAINDDDDDEIFLTQLAEGTTPLPTPARPLQATRLEEEDKWGRSLFQCPLCEARLPHAKMGKHMWGNTDNDPQYAPISIRRLAGPAAKTAEAGRAASSTRSTARLARNGLSRRPLCHGTRSTYSTHETRPSPRKRDERACPPSRSSAARCKHGPQNIQTIGFINCVVVCDEQAVLCR